MSERKSTLCLVCRAEVIAGTRFCWSCRPPQEPIAEVTAERGQLLWFTRDGRTTRKREVALVVFVDGAPVHVESHELNDRGSVAMPRLELQVREPGRERAASVEVHVDMREIFRALADGRERVDAARPRA